MTRSSNANLRHLARSMTATAALVAGGYLVMSGSTAEPAAGESTDKPGKNETWIEKSFLGGAGSDAKDDAPEQGNVEGGKEGKDGKPIAAKKTSSKSRKRDKLIQNAFRPGPKYETKYDAREQVDIYGAKSAVEPPRPLLEIGREQYTSGLYDQSSTLLGELNPLLPGLSVYGDWRTAIAYNNNNGKDIAQIATRLNLDVDFKFTATERIHAFFTPIQEGNANFTRFEFGGRDGDGKFNGEFDPDPQTLFFEGDFGSLYSGFSSKEASFDLPFTVGTLPAVPAERDLGERRYPRRRGDSPRAQLADAWPFQLRHHLLCGV